MQGASVGYSQAIKDTIVMNGDDFDAPIYYSAEDSIYADRRNGVIHLYGKAKVDNGEVRLDAGYIMIDLNNNEVLASYSYDKDSNMIDLPKFSDGGDEVLAQKVRYNFDTEKAFIEEVAIQQDENFLYMGTAKRHANEEIHFRKGRFTSCNLEEPHYHFQLSKAIMVPDKRIVSGPMNLWILGVPTPLGLPFSIIPQMEDKTQGLIFPEIVMPSTFGFGFQDLGYYIPINNSLQTTVYGSLYSRGSWGLANETDYAVRYKFTGSLRAEFQQFRRGFPETTGQNKTSFYWQHSKDPKSNPYWNFRSNVNFQSDNNTKNNLDPVNEQYFNNTLNSDIQIARNFPGKPLKAGAKLSMRQNSISENISLQSPVVNVNMTRVFPFKKLVSSTGKGKGLKDMLRAFSVTYNFEGKNQSLFHDSLLTNRDITGINNSFQNGFFQDTRMQTTASLFKNALKITPSFYYGNKMNFQQIERDTSGGLVVTDTVQRFGMAHDVRFEASATTVLYSYYRTIGKNKPLLRHVMTPSVSYSYRPNVNEVRSYALNDSTVVDYSPFEKSIYTVGITRDQNILTFGVNNTLELKRKSEKDTVDGFKRTRLIDAFTIRGSYDWEDTISPLSDIAMSMRVSPAKFINIVANANLSPYDWVDSTGATIDSVYAWRGRRTIGRITSFNITTSITFTSKKGRERLKNAVDNIGENWNADYNYYYLHPEEFLDFEIPWKLTFSHVYTISANQSISDLNPDRFNQVQTLMMNGDVSFTSRWKLSTRTSMDLVTGKIINSRISLNRNMHCWALSFDWTPIGVNKSFVFSMRSTSPLLQDIPINLRKPPTFL